MRSRQFTLAGVPLFLKGKMGEYKLGKNFMYIHRRPEQNIVRCVVKSLTSKSKGSEDF